MQPWTEQLSGYIRRNELTIIDACRRVLKDFEEELLVCESWQEMFDVIGLLDQVSDPNEFIKTLLNNYK